LDIAGQMVRPGVTTEQIDEAVHKATIAEDAYPSPLNYHFFPKSCCTSVNEVICHGIPDDRKLEDGDIVNIDITVFKDGYHGDLNETFLCGNVAPEYKKLVRTTYESLMHAIAAVRPGVACRDFGTIISKHVHAQGYQVVKSYCGHGIGDLFHCAPNIPHYARNKAVGICHPGMVFTIEPMINMGDWQDVTWPDDWTSVTKDGKRSAQFEHTMLVTEDGVEVLTARTADSVPLFWEIEGYVEEIEEVRADAEIVAQQKVDLSNAAQQELLNAPELEIEKKKKKKRKV
jgi:methionyl aminopeptidase